MNIKIRRTKNITEKDLDKIDTIMLDYNKLAVLDDLLYLNNCSISIFAVNKFKKLKSAKTVKQENKRLII